MGRLCQLLLFLLLCSGLSLAETSLEKVRELETRLEKSSKFSFELHNELRHHYSVLGDPRSYYHCDQILRNSPMDGYLLEILSGWAQDPQTGAERLLEVGEKHRNYQGVFAATRLRAADLLAEVEVERALELYREVADLSDLELERYRTIARSRLNAHNLVVGPRPWVVPVLEIRYFPLTEDGQKLDLEVTSNVGGTLEELRARCDRITAETMDVLEQGSRFRVYNDPKAEPSLKYRLVDTLEVLEPVPHDPNKPGFSDYRQILDRANIRHYVENLGVKEVWIWGYHSPELAPWESNMASVHGDISNSDRDPNDLPVFATTYTVYHYNYQRDTDMAVHNHIHQIESVMAHYGGDLWLLFTGEPGKWRAGNCHFPPNGRRDYDWNNKEYVWSDIEDWRPEGFGEKKKINSDRWGGNDLRWYTYWMQSLPGADNGLTYQGRALNDWWVLIGDYDAAVATETFLLSQSARPQTADSRLELRSKLSALTEKLTPQAYGAWSTKPLELVYGQLLGLP